MRERPRMSGQDRQLSPLKWMDRAKVAIRCPAKATSKMGHGHHCLRSDIKLPKDTTRDSMHNHKAAWFILKGTDRWATTATIPTRPTGSKARFTSRDSIKHCSWGPAPQRDTATGDGGLT